MFTLSPSCNPLVSVGGDWGCSKRRRELSRPAPPPRRRLLPCRRAPVSFGVELEGPARNGRERLPKARWCWRADWPRSAGWTTSSMPSTPTTSSEAVSLMKKARILPSRDRHGRQEDGRGDGEHADPQWTRCPRRQQGRRSSGPANSVRSTSTATTPRPERWSTSIRATGQARRTGPSVESRQRGQLTL